MTTTPTTEVISDAQTTEEKFLRQIMVVSYTHLTLPTICSV